MSFFFCGCITLNFYNNGESTINPSNLPAVNTTNPVNTTLSPTPTYPASDQTNQVYYYAVKPLVKAGTPFNSSKYPQDTQHSKSVKFQCYWDGTGSVYISGDKNALTGIYADDGYTLMVEPSAEVFDASEHWAHQHPVIDITSGMTPGLNKFTLIIQNWNGLSMSYGSINGTGIDQTPYIIQVIQFQGEKTDKTS